MVLPLMVALLPAVADPVVRVILLTALIITLRERLPEATVIKVRALILPTPVLTRLQATGVLRPIPILPIRLPEQFPARVLLPSLLASVLPDFTGCLTRAAGAWPTGELMCQAVPAAPLTIPTMEDRRQT